MSDARERYFELRKTNAELREVGKVFEGIEWDEEGKGHWTRHNPDTGHWLSVYEDDEFTPRGGVTVVFPDGKRKDYYFE